ncbi:MAG: ABC transporter permease [Firmicutes bacterium]|uniref:ABC transporter permease n=1 Tax=Candidatus Stercoripulliclostridium pullicola TaxID=2840953 RepID=A0A940IDJ0_9FIRM|nr:ABC transporter permease [Candidatus Stercoripulliclostridium pullicola]
MIKDIIRMSFQNLKMNKIRTFLTTLGIIIGIASIIALITIGQGVTSSVIEQLSGLGGNRVTVSITDTKAIPGFTDSNLREFTALENVEGISPSLRSYKPVTLVPGETNSLYNYVYTSSASVMGVNNYYFSLFAGGNLKAGRAINDDDVAFSTHVCVLGETVWKNLYGNYDPIGETIRIQNMDFVIVGILNNLVGLETRGNYSVIVPYTVAMTDLQMGLITTFDAIVSDTESMNITVSQMSDICADIVGSTQGYSVTNQQEVMDIVVTITDLILGMLAGIAAIALLVGGIGIMNMMLVSVSERTTEIGLRKALGAKPSVIMTQFLVEAVIISILGGILGVALGVSIAYVASLLIGYKFTFQMTTVLLAVGFSAAVGLIFGILPARKASKLNPIDALRAQ